MKESVVRLEFTEDISSPSVKFNGDGIISETPAADSPELNTQHYIVDGDNFDDELTVEYNPHLRHKSRQQARVTMNRSRHPEQVFVDRAMQILGTDKDTVQEQFSGRPQKAVRVNRLALPGDMTINQQTALLDAELAKADVIHHRLSWFAGALLFDSPDTHRVQATDMTERGQAFVQSPSSYLPVIALETEVGQSVIDVCAAPGGKTALIADLVQGEIDITANELKPRRAEKMRGVLNLLHLQQAQILTRNAKHLAKIIGENVFDRVLADVECSTEAGINFESKEPLKGWSLDRVERVAQTQRQIIRASYDLLRPGGILIYSTCSLAPEENEDVVASLLATRPGAIIQPVDLSVERRAKPIRKWNGKIIPEEVSTGVVRVVPNSYLEPFTFVRIRKPTNIPEIDELQNATVNLDELAAKARQDNDK